MAPGLRVVRRDVFALIHYTINDSASFVQQNRPGYLNCYKGSVLILPHAKSPLGLHVAIDKPIFLNPPFSPEDLGEACRQARALYNSEVPNTDWSKPSAGMTATGAKTWSEFSRKRKLVDVRFFPNEVIVSSTCRDLRGGYIGLDELHLPNEVTTSELGRAILNAFKKSAI